MERLLQRLSELATRRNLVAGLASVGVVLAILGMTGIGNRSSLSLLYSGLDAAAAGEVIGALDARGAAYEVRGNAIYVDAATRDSLRMGLAAEGLPRAGTEGYELLDSLSGFGTTSQMFDAAYWRAREGELARTILANPELRAARVHISATSGRSFDRDFRPSASVALTPGAAQVSETTARAVRYLVAAAVPRLSAEDVTVIDSRSGVVLGPEERPGAQTADRAEVLRRNAQALLEARVGAGRAVVEVALEAVEHSESIVERQLDPASRVQISAEVTERSGSSTESGPAGVTVASNLPTGDAAGGGQAQSRDSETRERTNFDVSETRREVIRGPGGIARLSVAVLVDGIRSRDESGAEVWQPRSAEELAALRELVASAVGYNEARGDVLSVRSLEFAPPAEEGTLVEAPGGLGLPLNRQALIELAALAAVALALAFFVLRPALLPRREPAAAPARDAEALPQPAPAVAGALTGTIDERPLAELGPEVQLAGDPGALPAPAEADPVARLRQLIADRREETAEILRAWMEEPEAAE